MSQLVPIEGETPEESDRRYEEASGFKVGWNIDPDTKPKPKDDEPETGSGDSPG